MNVRMVLASWFWSYVGQSISPFPIIACTHSLACPRCLVQLATPADAHAVEDPEHGTLNPGTDNADADIINQMRIRGRAPLGVLAVDGFDKVR